MTIFILKDGRRSGPFSIDEIKDQIACGLLDASALACLDKRDKWEPLVKILSHPERFLRPREKIKRIWEKTKGITAVVCAVGIGIYVFIVNLLSWIAQPDSLTAFLGLAALWFLRSIPYVTRTPFRRPSEEWLTWTLIVFALGLFACLSHLSLSKRDQTLMFGVVATAVTLVFTWLQLAKRQREEEQKRRDEHPTFRASQAATERRLREERKKEFAEFATELGIPTADKNER